MRGLRTSLVALALFPPFSPAAVVTSFNNAAGSSGNEAFVFSGQSVTTPAAGPWNHITFTFLGSGAVTPHALGTLYLFNEEYTGPPQFLPSARALASAPSVGAAYWQFDPSLTLQPNSRYFFYSGSQVITSGMADSYPGGQFHFALSPQDFYRPVPGGDAFFILAGQPVAIPEPGTFALAGFVLAALATRRF
ncbi:MAG: PEP-CTERM sorting domain-containing protein [Bryobacterales bacterium]|nr:PEP-CTERM sorting domain-containing protein [Bryobacterales bacterium]